MAPNAFQYKLRQTADLIKKSRRIILACHMNPDGDAIGSLLALGLGLKQLEKIICMLCPDPVPQRYLTLPGAYSIQQQYQDQADLAISVDCGSIIQLSSLEDVFERSKRIIEIDHHLYRTRFGDVQLVDHSACSVGEIIYQLLLLLGIRLDKRIAECLMISTLVETSSFSRQDIKPTTFDFCSQLMQLGINFQNISERYYWRKKLCSVRLCGLCYERIIPRANQQLVWSMIGEQDYKKFKGSQADVDCVADEMMMIENVKVALLFREIRGNMLRVSLRSRGRINIGYLASLYGGGGHRDVAGCRIHNSEKNLEKFINQACQLIYHNHRY